MPQNLIWLVKRSDDTGSRDPSARPAPAPHRRRSRHTACKPHGDRLKGGEAVASLAHMPADALGVPSSMAVPRRRPPEHRTPSVPHMRLGAWVMISPTWGFPPRRRQRWGESRLFSRITRSTRLRNTDATTAEAEPRPRCPSPSQGVPPRHQQSLVRDRGLRSPALCWWAQRWPAAGISGVERGGQNPRPHCRWR